MATSQAAAVLRALAWLDGRPDECVGAERRRTLWANAGVALDTVSSTVLTFGLILPGSGPVSSTLAANAAAGLPVRLTLGQVRHYLDKEREPSPDRLSTIFTCENPSVVEAASTSLATRSAPLICALMHTMLNHLVAIEEEIVMDLLLADLAAGIIDDGENNAHRQT